MNDKNQKKKNSGGLGWLIAVVLIGFFRLAGEALDSPEAILPLLFGAGLAAVIVLAVVTARKKSAGSRGKSPRQAPPPPPRTGPAGPPPMPAPRPAQRTAAPHRDFPQPEAHCVVCENTGEDHFLRDKARRIAQLDGWLKNGLIDRAEYAVLKDRYEKGI